MNFDLITSKENSLFKEVRNLQATGSKGQKARLASGQALLEGIHLVQTWVGDPSLRTLLTSEVGLKNIEISQAVYEHLEICPETKVFQLDSAPIRALLRSMVPDSFADISANASYT